MRTLSMEMGSEEAKRFSEVDLRNMYSRVKARAMNGRVCAGRDGNLASKNVKSLNDGSMKSRVSDEVNFGGIGRKMEGVDSVIKTKELATSESNNVSAAKRTKLVHSVMVDGGQVAISSTARNGNRGAREGHAILGCNFLNPKSDEGIALKMLDVSREERLNTLGYQYEVGDLVWGKVKSHPWWPAQIFDEAFASPSVFATKKEGHVWVSFYGDNSYGWLKPADVIPFDVHYAEKSKQTNARKFLTAVEEVVDEVKRRAALGLACPCQLVSNFRPTSVKGFFEVDVRGYEPDGLYSLKQIEKAKDDFQPFKLLSFVRKLALVPQTDVQIDIKCMKNVAQVLAYRMTVSEEFDETNAQEFGKQPVRARDSVVVVLKDQEKMPLEEKMTSLHGVAFNQLNPNLHLRMDGFSPLEQIEMENTSSKELRQIGMTKMIWEESVSLWGEEGENQMGRVKVQELSFLNAEVLSFFGDSTVACTMEAFEDGPHKGLSVHRFLSDQQVNVSGTRKSSSAPAPSAIPPLEFKDPTEYYLERLRVPEQTLPSLHELWGKLREPPPVELRFPLHNDVYRDLPPGKERFFTASEQLDCRAITSDILGPIIRPNPGLISTTAGSRDSFIGLWDDCINRIVSKFCSINMVLIRKPSSTSSSLDTLQDQWPNLTGLIRNFCLWRGEETDQLRSGDIKPSTSMLLKHMWTYTDIPYILGYYAVGHRVTFCALSRLHDRTIQNDLYTVDLSVRAERLNALVPCWRIAGLLTLLADRCSNCKLFLYSDFDRIHMGNGDTFEMTPNTTTRFFTKQREWAAVKEIYGFLDNKIPHAEVLVGSSERDLALVFNSRGSKIKPQNCDQLVKALIHVTEALVELHKLSFMHRDLGWDKVIMRIRNGEKEWFLTGFDEAVATPQMSPHGGGGVGGAPEMWTGLHDIKVDMWGVGQLVWTCGLLDVPGWLTALQDLCLQPNPEHRPTAAQCLNLLQRRYRV